MADVLRAGFRPSVLLIQPDETEPGNEMRFRAQMADYLSTAFDTLEGLRRDLTDLAAAGGGGGGGTVTDGDKGDISVSVGGTVWTIDNGAVTNAKLAAMAQATVKGRAAGAGTGAPADLNQSQLTALINTFTPVLPGAVPLSGGGTANYLRADGTWAAPPGIGITDGDKGDIEVAIGGTVWVVGVDTIDNLKLANMANNTVKGRVAGSTGDPQNLTTTQLTTLVDVFTSTLKGAVPLSGGGTANFLRADGTWAAPPAGGGGITDGDKGDVIVSGSGATWLVDTTTVMVLTGAQTIGGAKTFTIAPRIQSTQPQLEFEETDTAKVWKMFISADIFYLRNDANANILKATAAGVLMGDGSGLTALDADNLAAGTVAQARLSESIIRNLIAQGTAGAIGTYAFLIRTGTSANTWNGNYAGSAFLPGGVSQPSTAALVDGGGSAPSGTWKAMGQTSSQAQGNGTLFLRVA